MHDSIIEFSPMNKTSAIAHGTPEDAAQMSGSRSTQNLSETTLLPSGPANTMSSSASHRALFVPAPALASSRYNRQILIPSVSLEGQKRISSSRVLIIGLGGLGSPASLYLAGAGVGLLGLCDDDVVEVGNLHRQIVHRESSVHGIESEDVNSTHDDQGVVPMTKVASALRGCRELNSEPNYVGHEVKLDGQNALEIIRGYDIVLDCTDNPATRYLISDVCVMLDKTLISGAAQRLEGQIAVLNYPVYDQEPKELSHRGGLTNGTNINTEDKAVDGKQKFAEFASKQTITENMTTQVSRGPCYRCVFPVPPSPEMVKGCSEIGILGPVVGTIGTLMASETLRIICRPNEGRKPTMLLYNAWSTDPRAIFRTIGLRGRRKDCVACGDEEVVHEKGKVKINKESIRSGMMDYEVFCGKVEDISILQEEQRISAQDFLSGTKPGNGVVIDIREELEVELGSKIKGSINIPMSRILRNGAVKNSANEDAEQDELEQALQASEGRPVYLLCQRGNDSQIVAQKLIDRQQKQPDKNGKHDEKKRWIGDVRGGFVAIERAAAVD